ncbi:MAG: AAA family ATPase [Candidatus Omnitrophota bacterium]
MIQGLIESKIDVAKWVRMWVRILEERFKVETERDVLGAVVEALAAGYKAGAPVGITDAGIEERLNTENWGGRLAAVKMIQGFIERRIAVAKWVRILEERFKVETDPEVLIAWGEALAAGYGEGAPVGLTDAVSSGEWRSLREFGKSSETKEINGDNGERIFENAQGLRWKINEEGNFQISQNNGQFIPLKQNLEGNGPRDLYEIDASRILAFDQISETVNVLVKENDAWRVEHELMMEEEDRANSWDGVMLRLIGETGLGKDEITLAAANLIGEEVYVAVGNSDMDVEDLVTGFQSLGGQEKGTSGVEPSGLNKVMHNGGWYIIREAHKLRPGVFNALKSHVSAKDHKWPVMRDGIERFETIQNNPRARVVLSVNRIRKGITGASTETNGPMQDRERDLEFYWLEPDDEVDLQVEYALAMAREKGLHSDDWETFEDQVRKDARELVDIAAQLRLTFAGYNAEQQAEILRDWNLIDSKNLVQKMVKDSRIKQLFESGPAFETGEMLKRPPSPRVVKNILQHLILFPKDRRYRSFEIVKKYYNFHAEISGELEEAAIEKFTEWESKRPDSHPVKLTEKSFIVDGQDLIIRPEPEADGTTYWDEVRVPLHSKASIRTRGVPGEVLDWIKSGANAQNLYSYLQGRALGKHWIFVGKPGAGKSTMIAAIQKLLNAPGSMKLEITEETRKDHLTYSRNIKEFETRFTKEVLPSAMEDEYGEGQILNLTESTQGRPSMLSLLNEVSERNELPDPNSKTQVKKAKRGFGTIHDINPPGTADRLKAFPDDFIERHMIMWFDTPPSDQVTMYLEEAGQGRTFPEDIKFQVHPSLIGQPRQDANGNSEKYDDGEIKYTGIVGIGQEINRKLMEDPYFFPKDREISYRNLQAFVKAIVAYYERDISMGNTPQDVILNLFMETFTLEGKPGKMLEWRTNILKVFQDLGLYDPQAGQDDGSGGIVPDAIEKFLNKEGVLVQNLPVLKEPDSGYLNIDRILRFLQTNTVGLGIRRNLDELSSEAGKLLSAETKESLSKWNALPVSEKARRLRAIREIYDVLGLIKENRFDSKQGPAYQSEEQVRLGAIIEQIVSVIVVQWNWPQEIFTRADLTETAKMSLTEILDRQRDRFPEISNAIYKVMLSDGKKEYLDELEKEIAKKGKDVSALKEIVNILKQTRALFFQNLIKSLNQKIREEELAVSNRQPDAPDQGNWTRAQVEEDLARVNQSLAGIEKERGSLINNEVKNISLREGRDKLLQRISLRKEALLSDVQKQDGNDFDWEIRLRAVRIIQSLVEAGDDSWDMLLEERIMREDDFDVLEALGEALGAAYRAGADVGLDEENIHLGLEAQEDEIRFGAVMMIRALIEGGNDIEKWVRLLEKAIEKEEEFAVLRAMGDVLGMGYQAGVSSGLNKTTVRRQLNSDKGSESRAIQKIRALIKGGDAATRQRWVRILEKRILIEEEPSLVKGLGEVLGIAYKEGVRCGLDKAKIQSMIQTPGGSPNSDFRLGALQMIRGLIEKGMDVGHWVEVLEKAISVEMDQKLLDLMGDALAVGYQAGAPVGLDENFIKAGLEVRGIDHWEGHRLGAVKSIRALIQGGHDVEKWSNVLAERRAKEDSPIVVPAIQEAMEMGVAYEKIRRGDWESLAEWSSLTDLSSAYEALRAINAMSARKQNSFSSEWKDLLIQKIRARESELTLNSSQEDWKMLVVTVRIIQRLIESGDDAEKWVGFLEDEIRDEVRPDVLMAFGEALGAVYRKGAPFGLREGMIRVMLNDDAYWKTRAGAARMIQGLIESGQTPKKWVSVLKRRLKSESDVDVLHLIGKALAAAYRRGLLAGGDETRIKRDVEGINADWDKGFIALNVIKSLIEDGQEVEKWVRFLESKIKTEQDDSILRVMIEALGAGYRFGIPVELDVDTIKEILSFKEDVIDWEIRFAADGLVLELIKRRHLPGTLVNLLEQQMLVETHSRVLPALSEALEAGYRAGVPSGLDPKEAERRLQLEGKIEEKKSRLGAVSMIRAVIQTGYDIEKWQDVLRKRMTGEKDEEVLAAIKETLAMVDIYEKIRQNDLDGFGKLISSADLKMIGAVFEAVTVMGNRTGVVDKNREEEVKRRERLKQRWDQLVNRRKVLEELLEVLKEQETLGLPGGASLFEEEKNIFSSERKEKLIQNMVARETEIERALMTVGGGFWRNRLAATKAVQRLIEAGLGVQKRVGFLEQRIKIEDNIDVLNAMAAALGAGYRAGAAVGLTGTKFEEILEIEKDHGAIRSPAAKWVLIRNVKMIQSLIEGGHGDEKWVRLLEQRIAVETDEEVRNVLSEALGSGYRAGISVGMNESDIEASFQKGKGGEIYKIRALIRGGHGKWVDFLEERVRKEEKDTAAFLGLGKLLGEVYQSGIPTGVDPDVMITLLNSGNGMTDRFTRLSLVRMIRGLIEGGQDVGVWVKALEERMKKETNYDVLQSIGEALGAAYRSGAHVGLDLDTIKSKLNFEGEDANAGWPVRFGAARMIQGLIERGYNVEQLMIMIKERVRDEEINIDVQRALQETLAMAGIYEKIRQNDLDGFGKWISSANLTTVIAAVEVLDAMRSEGKNILWREWKEKLYQSVVSRKAGLSLTSHVEDRKGLLVKVGIIQRLIEAGQDVQKWVGLLEDEIWDEVRPDVVMAMGEALGAGYRKGAVTALTEEMIAGMLNDDSGDESWKKRVGAARMMQGLIESGNEPAKWAAILEQRLRTGIDGTWVLNALGDALAAAYRRGIPAAWDEETIKTNFIGKDDDWNKGFIAANVIKRLIEDGQEVEKWVRFLEQNVDFTKNDSFLRSSIETLATGYRSGISSGLQPNIIFDVLNFGADSSGWGIRFAAAGLVGSLIESGQAREKWVGVLELRIFGEEDFRVLRALSDALGAGYRAGVPVGLDPEDVEKGIDLEGETGEQKFRFREVSLIGAFIQAGYDIEKWRDVLKKRMAVEKDENVLSVIKETLTTAVVDEKIRQNDLEGFGKWVSLAHLTTIRTALEVVNTMEKRMGSVDKNREEEIKRRERIQQRREQLMERRKVLEELLEVLREQEGLGLTGGAVFSEEEKNIFSREWKENLYQKILSRKEEIKKALGAEDLQIRLDAVSVIRELIENGKDIGEWVEVLEQRFRIEDEPRLVKALGEALGSAYRTGVPCGLSEEETRKKLDPSNWEASHFELMRFGAIKLIHGLIEGGHDKEKWVRILEEKFSLSEASAASIALAEALVEGYRDGVAPGLKEEGLETMLTFGEGDGFWRFRLAAIKVIKFLIEKGENVPKWVEMLEKRILVEKNDTVMKALSEALGIGYRAGAPAGLNETLINTSLGIGSSVMRKREVRKIQSLIEGGRDIGKWVAVLEMRINVETNTEVLSALAEALSAGYRAGAAVGLNETAILAGLNPGKNEEEGVRAVKMIQSLIDAGLNVEKWVRVLEHKMKEENRDRVVQVMEDAVIAGYQGGVSVGLDKETVMKMLYWEKDVLSWEIRLRAGRIIQALIQEGREIETWVAILKSRKKRERTWDVSSALQETIETADAYKKIRQNDLEDFGKWLSSADLKMIDPVFKAVNVMENRAGVVDKNREEEIKRRERLQQRQDQLVNRRKVLEELLEVLKQLETVKTTFVRTRQWTSAETGTVAEMKKQTVEVLRAKEQEMMEESFSKEKARLIQLLIENGSDVEKRKWVGILEERAKSETDIDVARSLGAALGAGYRAGVLPGLTEAEIQNNLNIAWIGGIRFGAVKMIQGLIEKGINVEAWVRILEKRVKIETDNDVARSLGAALGAGYRARVLPGLTEAEIQKNLNTGNGTDNCGIRFIAVKMIQGLMENGQDVEKWVRALEEWAKSETEADVILALEEALVAGYRAGVLAGLKEEEIKENLNSVVWNIRFIAVKMIQGLIENGRDVAKWVRALEERAKSETDGDVIFALVEALVAGYKTGVFPGLTETEIQRNLNAGNDSEDWNIRLIAVKMIQGLIENGQDAEKWVRALEEWAKSEKDADVIFALGEALGVGYRTGISVGLTETEIQKNLNTGNSAENWKIRFSAVKIIQGLIENGQDGEKWMKILEERVKTESNENVLQAMGEAMARGFIQKEDSEGFALWGSTVNASVLSGVLTALQKAKNEEEEIRQRSFETVDKDKLIERKAVLEELLEVLKQLETVETTFVRTRQWNSAETGTAAEMKKQMVEVLRAKEQEMMEGLFSKEQVRLIQVLIENRQDAEKWMRRLEEQAKSEADTDTVFALGEALAAGYRAGVLAGLKEEEIKENLNTGNGNVDWKIRFIAVKIIQGLIESGQDVEKRKWVGILEKRVKIEADADVIRALGEALGAGDKAGVSVRLTETEILENLNNGNGTENWKIRFSAVKMIQGLIENEKDVEKWVRILEKRAKIETDGSVVLALGEALGAGYRAGVPAGLTETEIEENLNAPWTWGSRFIAVKMIQGLIENEKEVEKWVRILEKRVKIEIGGDVVLALGEALGAGYKAGASAGLTETEIKENLTNLTNDEDQRFRFSAVKIIQGLIENGQDGEKWMKVLEDRVKTERNESVLQAVGEAMARGFIQKEDSEGFALWGSTVNASVLSGVLTALKEAMKEEENPDGTLLQQTLRKKFDSLKKQLRSLEDGNSIGKKADSAILTEDKDGNRDKAGIKPPGGIDLNPQGMEMEIQGNGGFQWDLPANFDLESIEGLTPVIIEIAPGSFPVSLLQLVQAK